MTLLPRGAKGPARLALASAAIALASRIEAMTPAIGGEAHRESP